MKNYLYKINKEILIQLKKNFLHNTKQILENIPDYSIDISELDLKQEYRKLIGPCIIFLYQKELIILTKRRITITPKGIEELEPFYIKYKYEIALTLLAGGLGIIGTIIGVVFTLLFTN